MKKRKVLHHKSGLLLTLLLILSLLVASFATAFPAAPPNYPMYDTANINNETNWNIMNAHDPEVIKDGGYYWVYSTDYKVGGTAAPGIQVRRSTDLVNWSWYGYAFSGMPAGAQSWTGVNVLWAPEIVKMGSTYYLYYCASQFGTRTSYIGVATSSSPAGPWTDKGEVFKSKDGDGNQANAIDPNIVFDASGNPWLSYGSFFGGIYLARIDAATGKLVTYNQGTLIAKRASSVIGGVEAPNLVYNAAQGMYYLFTSYDSCCSAFDYNVRVGRSASITGPYKDYNGNELTNTTLTPSEVGTKVLGSYKFNGSEGWYGPGHNTILQDGSNWYMLHHARGASDKNWTYLHVRKMLWTGDGWPVVSPERYTGETESTLTSNTVIGQWESIVLDRNNNGQLTSSTISLLASGKIGSETSANRWEFTAPNTLKLYWHAPGQAPNDYWIDTVKVMESWDWEKNRRTYIYTGMNQSGTNIWGKKSDAPIVSGAVYKLINAGSNKALDVASGGTANGTNVQIWADNGLTPQEWIVTRNTDGTYKLTNTNSNRVLDVANGGTTDGTNVQIWDSNGFAAQKWNLNLNADGSYTLINTGSGKALEVANGGTANGTNVQIWTPNSSNAQKWWLIVK